MSVDETSATATVSKSQPSEASVGSRQSAAAGSGAAAPSLAVAKVPKRWTISKVDEILMIAAPDALPHLFPLNPKHTWPIGAERMRVVEAEAERNNPCALSLLGTYRLLLLLLLSLLTRSLPISGTVQYAGLGRKIDRQKALANMRRAIDLGSDIAVINLSSADGTVRSRLQQAVGGPLLAFAGGCKLSAEFTEWAKRAVDASDYRAMAMAVR